MRFLFLICLCAMATVGTAQVIVVESFEGSLPGPLPTIPTLGAPLPFSKGGSAIVLPDPVVPPQCGFPTHGQLWGYVGGDGTGPENSPPCGPPPRPFATGTGNITIPMFIPAPPPGCDVVLCFDWTFVTPECAQDPVYNDFFDVSFTTPTGTGRLPLQQVLYRDTFSASMSAVAGTPNNANVIPVGFCTPPGALEECIPCAPKRHVFTVSPNLHDMMVELQFDVGNGNDNSYPSHAWIDNVRLSIATPGTPGFPVAVITQTPAPPGAGACTLGDATIVVQGTIPGAPGFTVFSGILCPGGPGTGPNFGLCEPIAGILAQVYSGVLPFAWIGAGCSTTTSVYPPGSIPPGLCLEHRSVQIVPGVPAMLGKAATFASQ